MIRSLCVVLLISVAAPAGAEDMPQRKSGLWEIQVRMPSGKGDITHQCVGPGRDWKTDTCSKHEVTKTATGYVVESICQAGPYVVTSKNVISGDFETTMVIAGEVKTRGVPGLDPNFVARVTNDLRYLGPCKEGQSPGDLIASNGKVTPWAARK